jgi:hypothetical protein
MLPYSSIRYGSTSKEAFLWQSCHLDFFWHNVPSSSFNAYKLPAGLLADSECSGGGSIRRRFVETAIGIMLSFAIAAARLDSAFCICCMRSTVYIVKIPDKRRLNKCCVQKSLSRKDSCKKRATLKIRHLT